MMFIVDGTGEKDDDAYEKDMAGGFCKHLERQCSGRYWRGPTALGTEVHDITIQVTEAVIAWKKIARKESKLFLAGHSRGGAVVVYVAKELIDAGIDVDAMFLFDAVERVLDLRRPFRSAGVVPRNVKACYHALRDTSLTFMYSDGALAARDEVARLVGLPTGPRTATMEDMLDLAMKSPPKTGAAAKAIERAKRLADQDGRMKYVMRSTTMKTPSGWTVDFGNCATTAERPETFHGEKFLGSHGALGGAPIIDTRAPELLLDSDRAAMASVRAWMWGNLAREGAIACEAR